MTSVWAVYENGVLRPIEPHHLQEGERVLITIQTEDDIKLRKALGESVQWPQLPYDSDAEAWAEEKRIVDQFSKALSDPDKLMSDIIIEDREDRF